MKRSFPDEERTSNNSDIVIFGDRVNLILDFALACATNLIDGFVQDTLRD